MSIGSSEGPAFIHRRQLEGYPCTPPFDPPERYPEMTDDTPTDTSNGIYSLVRDLLMNLRLDAGNLGTPMWNPLGEIIKPGFNVLVKPNWVTHRHYLGREALYGSITHGSILRPLIDYVRLALGGSGSIIIGDSPVEIADFQEIMSFTGTRDMADELAGRGFENLRILDLRPRVRKESRGGGFHHEPLPGDPLGYVKIDLAGDSLFSNFDSDQSIHYYTLADQTVDHFDPRSSVESTTDRYHNPGFHQYVISKTVLDADVVINVSKMKTHCKAGVSMALKNMIGMVHLKECMPHHRPGKPPEGDSFPDYPAVHYTASRKTYRYLRRSFGVHRLPGFRSFRDALQKREILVGRHIEHGNWSGNDTLWRTILDLNRIALYADKEGRMRDEPQRRILCVVDGVVAQQGEGPMSGEPVNSSIIIGGFNPVSVDALAVKVMGIDYQMIKTLRGAMDVTRWKLVPEGKWDLGFPQLAVPALDFAMPKGWS